MRTFLQQPKHLKPRIHAGYSLIPEISGRSTDSTCQMISAKTGE
jgi:hypothetical protein